MYFTTKTVMFKTEDELDKELKLLYEKGLEPWHADISRFGGDKGGVATIKFKGK